jgi:hypothetical protein
MNSLHKAHLDVGVKRSYRTNLLFDRTKPNRNFDFYRITTVTPHHYFPAAGAGDALSVSALFRISYTQQLFAELYPLKCLDGGCTVIASREVSSVIHDEN